MSDQSEGEEEQTVYFPHQDPIVLPGKTYQKEHKTKQTNKGSKRIKEKTLSKSLSLTSNSSFKRRRRRKPKKIKESVLDPTKATTRKEWEDMVFNYIPQTGEGGSRQLITALNPGEIHLKEHLPLLLMLSLDSAHHNQKQRHAVIDHMTQKQMDVISQFLHDFLHLKYPIPPDVVDQLVKDKKAIYKLVSNQTSLDEKKQTLKQRGGFLPLAALAGAPLLGLLGKVALEPLIKGTVGALFNKVFHKHH